jgi:hypothetical protein
MKGSRFVITRRLYWDRGRLARKRAAGANCLLLFGEDFFALRAHCGRDARGPRKKLRSNSQGTANRIKDVVRLRLIGTGIVITRRPYWDRGRLARKRAAGARFFHSLRVSHRDSFRASRSLRARRPRSQEEVALKLSGDSLPNQGLLSDWGSSAPASFVSDSSA